MKSKRKILVNILILLIIVCILVLWIIFNKFINPTIKAVVVKVGEKYLIVMDSTNSNLYDVSYTSDNNIKYKQGQEVLIYYDGFINQSSPAQICNVKKIEILNQESATEIPIGVLKRCYSTMDNVFVSIDKISPIGMTIEITDKNKYKYEYSNKYAVYKKQKLWEEVPRISDDETVYSTNIGNNTIKVTYNWENIYGKLESGEYKLTVSTDDKPSLNITIMFTIDENNEILYYEPELIIF